MIEILRYIYEATKYFDYLKEHHFKDHEARWQNLGELLNIAKRTRTGSSKPSDSFYDQGGFVSDEDEIDLDDASGFSDIDIDRYRNDGTPALQLDYNTDSNRHRKNEEKTEFDFGIPQEESEKKKSHTTAKNESSSVKAEDGVKSEPKSKNKEGVKSEPGIKSEPTVKNEPKEEEYVLEDMEVDK